MTLDLFTPGAYCRAGGGNLERPELHAPVVKWVAWNLDNGTDPPQHGAGIPAFKRARELWAQAGIPDFPWVYCHDLEEIDRLIDAGLELGSPAIGANIENVKEDFTDHGIGLADVAARLARWTKPVHIATLAWVQNGQGWSALKRYVFALEIFPDEVPVAAADVDGCIAHAFAEGIELLTLMYKTKPPNAPEDYDLSICHSLYTADDITVSAEAWNLWRAPEPCEKLRPVAPVPPWYEKPYATGPPVGPEKLPRALYPPIAGKGTFVGDDVIAFKRGISRGGRLLPWSPATWSPAYGDAFALGKGTGRVGDSGVRGFQRQTWPNDPSMQTGNLGNATYQALRRARVSDPESAHYGEPLLDARAVALLNRAAAQYLEDLKHAKFRAAVADFCTRSELASEAAWTYSQARPFTGLGVAPELAHVNDCSSYAILAYFWGRSKSGLAVPDPSDYAYSGFGNTWDDLDGHPSVLNGQYLVGDLAHYRGHVTICKLRGDALTSRWSSFGSEPRPEERTLHYRPDFLKVVRPPLE